MHTLLFQPHHQESVPPKDDFSEEAWSCPANGGMKFCQDRAVQGRRNGVVTLLEFSEWYALAIPEHRQHDVPGRWCHLKFLCIGDTGCFHCMEACFISGS